MVIKVVILMIFLAIAVTSIWFLLSPAVNHEKTLQGDDMTVKPSGLSYNGLVLRYDAWKTYPEYNIGFGVMASLGFIGSILSAISILKETGARNED